MIAEAVGRSRLVAAGGAIVVNLLSRAEVTSLLGEVRSSLAEAHLAASEERDDSVRGQPERRVVHLPGGPALAALYAGERLSSKLTEYTAVHWRMLGAQASYSVYQGGSFLGPHRDIIGCDLTAIVVLLDTVPSRSPLWTWPRRSREPLDALRADPLSGRIECRAAPGQAIVVLGSTVPHAVPIIPSGQIRIVAPLCFSAPPPRR